MNTSISRAAAVAALLMLAVLMFMLPLGTAPVGAQPASAQGGAKDNYYLVGAKVNRTDKTGIGTTNMEEKAPEQAFKGNPDTITFTVQRPKYTLEGSLKVVMPPVLEPGQTFNVSYVYMGKWDLQEVDGRLQIHPFGYYQAADSVDSNLENAPPGPHTLTIDKTSHPKFNSGEHLDFTTKNGVTSFTFDAGATFNTQGHGDSIVVDVTYTYANDPKLAGSSGTGSTPGPTAANYPPTFAGEWGDWGPKVGAHRGSPPPGTEGTWGTWTFQQNGGNVTGTILNMGGKYGPATITGTVSGKTLTGTWKSPNASGTITLTRSGDDSSFAGTYTVNLPAGEPPGSIGPPTSTPPLPEGMILQAPDLIVAKGARVLVPVQLINARDVIGMDFELAYLPDIAAAQAEAEKGSVITDIWEYKLNQPGLFKFNFAQLAPFAGQGTVGGFRFDAVGPGRGRTPLTLSVHRVDGPNGAKLPITVINGSITIYDPTDLTDPNNPKNPNRPGATGPLQWQPTCSGTGRQTVNDAQCCLKMWVGLIPKSLVMDLNNDNEVDSADALIILQNVAKDLAR